MSKEKENNDSLVEDENVVTLISGDGEEVDFYEIAGIEHEDNFYVILQPVEMLEGMEDDEAFVFKVMGQESEEEASYEIVDDDALLDVIFEKYNKLIDEEEAEEEK